MSDGSALLWFHAFNRDAFEDIVNILMTGPQPNSDPDTITHSNEVILGIDQPCVYAYLGRTIEAFGKRAIALTQDAIQDGQVSPFDTGGLMKHIQPICRLDDNTKKQFLEDHTWEIHLLPSLLAQYPGYAVSRYLDGQRPTEQGPHNCLPVSGTVKANIWGEGENSWQAWTWEGRSADNLHVGDKMVAWTCHPDEQSALLLDIANKYSDEEAESLGIVNILAKYHRGGVSNLVAELRYTQEDPNA